MNFIGSHWRQRKNAHWQNFVICNPFFSFKRDPIVFEASSRELWRDEVDVMLMLSGHVVEARLRKGKECWSGADWGTNVHFWCGSFALTRWKYQTLVARRSDVRTINFHSVHHGFDFQVDNIPNNMKQIFSKEQQASMRPSIRAL